jgi:transcriptional regulator with XRE-family HTH domain
MAVTEASGAPSADGAGIDSEVGERIRLLRRARKLSLEIVAARCDVSIGFLSQIERGLSSPSLRLLTSLADVLGVTFSSLFVAPDGRDRQEAAGTVTARDVVVRANRRAKLKLWRAGIQKQSLTAPAANMPFSYFVMRMAKGASSGPDLYTHSGTEAGLVLEGRLLLTVGNVSWTLMPGDSFSFPSRRPHSFANAARGKTSVVMVLLPE